jgi:2-polyprenyl-3-methyl-5-hydroxy-6-metoxy-1,4-benzoquinol methylase
MNTLSDKAKKAMKHNRLLWMAFDLYYHLHNRLTLKKYKTTFPPTAVVGEPTLENITSQVATAAQCFEPIYHKWCGEMRSPARMHRKQWEFIYILQALKKHGCIRDGSRGLGFGCGQEPIPALLARAGCEITATDLDFASAKEKGWVDSRYHAACLEQLNPFTLCPDHIFQEKANFRVVDMNDIPEDLAGYDFLWSSCALEHLGSGEKGLTFVKEAMSCLKLGGIAVHTTEYNISSDDNTFESEDLYLYRKSDLLRLATELEEAGHRVQPFNFSTGSSPIDAYVDLPPYRASPSLKIQVQQFAVTSIGIIIQKA